MTGHVCRWCGSHEIDDETTTDTVFACGSARRLFSDICFQSAGCEEILNLRKRIAAAVEAAQQANRFDMSAERDGSMVAQLVSDGGYAWASVLDDIVSILQGNSPTNLEGST